MSSTRGYDPTYYDGGSDLWTIFTSPVGTFAPNGYGLYQDMCGNVRQWCWDVPSTS